MQNRFIQNITKLFMYCLGNLLVYLKGLNS